MFLIIIAYILHLGINQISFFIGTFYISLFSFIGKIIHAIILHIEDFYNKNPQYKDKIILELLFLKKEIMLYSFSQKLLKSQIKNKNNKKYYSFFQKLKAVLLYLVFMPDKKQIQVKCIHRKV